MRDRHPGRKGLRDQLDLLAQVLNIGGDRRVTRSKLHVAAAIPAHLFAERHVQIKRDRLVAVESSEPSTINSRGKLRREMRRGGVTGVARYVSAGVFFECGRHRNVFQSAASRARIAGVSCSWPLRGSMP